MGVQNNIKKIVVETRCRPKMNVRVMRYLVLLSALVLLVSFIVSSANSSPVSRDRDVNYNSLGE